MKYSNILFKTFLVSSLFFLSIGCVSTKNTMEHFEKIIFHSTTCYGSCPSLSLEVHADRSTKLQRQFYAFGGKEIAANSGTFQGSMNKQSFKLLMKTLKNSQYEKLAFPNIDCCDAPVITIIIYANGKRTYLKSMMPLQEATELIQFLTELTKDINLPTTTEKFEIEQ
ncbi:MAG: hypothetical protein KF781_05275 [Chitinophagaceae bacterium]|nr:hypothetical protein [Chitinophagaceae bacterium]MCW5905929.1 hypothetical protein [Chitinophagaceae bacterium]